MHAVAEKIVNAISAILLTKQKLRFFLIRVEIYGFGIILYNGGAVWQNSKNKS